MIRGFNHCILLVHSVTRPFWDTVIGNFVRFFMIGCLCECGPFPFQYHLGTLIFSLQPNVSPFQRYSFPPFCPPAYHAIGQLPPPSLPQSCGTVRSWEGRGGASTQTSISSTFLPPASGRYRYFVGGYFYPLQYCLTGIILVGCAILSGSLLFFLTYLSGLFLICSLSGSFLFLFISSVPLLFFVWIFSVLAYLFCSSFVHCLDLFCSSLSLLLLFCSLFDLFCSFPLVIAASLISSCSSLISST